MDLKLTADDLAFRDELRIGLEQKRAHVAV